MCDRYIASSLALQCMDGVDREFVYLLNEEVVQPDLVILLSGLPEVIAERLAARGTHSRYEREDSSRRIECAYFAEAGKFLRGTGHRVLDVDTSGVGTEEAASAVVAAVTRLIKNQESNVAGRADVQLEQPVPGAREAAAPVSGGATGSGAGADGGGAQRGV
ncbi:hypothetical protein ACWCXE_03900 [Streptomyces sp. NPDC001780]